MTNKILVIIVTFNGLKWIDKCIQSVLSSDIESDIFVIDNKSSDSTVEYIRKQYPSVMIHENKSNMGFGQANNIGLQYAIDNDYDYVYLLNQDAWIKPNTLRALINVQKENPDYGVISPIQLQANEKHFDSNFYSIACNTNFKEKFGEDTFLQQTQQIYPVKRVMAAHWLISRKCLLEVGGFSPSFQHYGEDDNYADRAWEKKFKVGFSPAAIGIHDRESRIEDINKKTYLRYCQAVSDISGFEKSIKQSLYDFAYDVFFSIIWGNYNRKQMIKYFFHLLKKINILKRTKVHSLQICAFLKK